MFRSAAAILGLAALALTAGCQANPEASARSVPLAQSAVGANQPQDWRFASLEVVVPASLTVSEENSIKPRADIVWREDPCCNRHEQVDRLMTDALQPVLARMPGSQPVRIELTVTRFHALTERTRYTIGGEHEIEFDLVVRDAATGAILRGPRHVDVTFPGAGGDNAVAEEARGYFQRDAIRDRLQQWALAEFRIVPVVPAP
ncbi:hypothetical protein HKCCE2091_15370 [Rhodobacterales bacterium HKCCE2091]|nr:hypothetical protein [Rhodobacterales bacterium HKCCE2091]